ncbi:hypothetical protein ACFU99_06650 [Streptomyces sp. NPDC057654]|uniref:hypothetical protein n=1 Tax=Streptomyces sp. NPDC057654 TaxID=3346196 RepID=UPI0036C73A31
MKRSLACLAALLPALWLTGCGTGSTGPVRAGGPASGLRDPVTETGYAHLYFVGPGGLQSVTRKVTGQVTPQRALDLLFKGPDTAELARGLRTEVPPYHRPVIAEAAEGAVDVRLPVAVADTNSGGDNGYSQIICTAANAHLPGGRQPPNVNVHVHEPGYQESWTVRCDAAGNVVPVLGH